MRKSEILKKKREVWIYPGFGDGVDVDDVVGFDDLEPAGGGRRELLGADGLGDDAPVPLLLLLADRGRATGGRAVRRVVVRRAVGARRRRGRGPRFADSAHLAARARLLLDRRSLQSTRLCSILLERLTVQ